jgi:hypothetical protein
MTQLRTSGGTARAEILLEYYKVMAVPTLLDGSEAWILVIRIMIKPNSADEVRFLRAVAGYSEPY